MTACRDVIKFNHPICELKCGKTYKSGEIVCPANGVYLQCNAGDFISIKGPSGIGKSTLLYLVGGLLQADSGEISVDATVLQGINEHDLTVCVLPGLVLSFRRSIFSGPDSW